MISTIGGNARLAGKRALVTGAASGIGRAVAIRFAQEGARVGLLDRNAAGLQQVLETIRSGGGFAHAAPVDLAIEDQVQTGVSSCAEALGGVEIIAAVAGIELGSAGDNRVHLIDLASWQKTIGANLTGMFLTLKHGIGAMLATGNGGSVIITGSPCGMRGSCSDQHAYSASKAGTHGFVRPLAADYAADNIRVNCVIPGFIDTPLTAEFVADEQFVTQITKRIPLRRPGRADEVANLFAWLASDDASYVTGAFYAADGGQTAM